VTTLKEVAGGKEWRSISKTKEGAWNYGAKRGPISAPVRAKDPPEDVPTKKKKKNPEDHKPNLGKFKNKEETKETGSDTEATFVLLECALKTDTMKGSETSYEKRPRRERRRILRKKG